jgi:hypothetical protein
MAGDALELRLDMLLAGDSASQTAESPPRSASKSKADMPTRTTVDAWRRSPVGAESTPVAPQADGSTSVVPALALPPLLPTSRTPNENGGALAGPATGEYVDKVLISRGLDTVREGSRRDRTLEIDPEGDGTDRSPARTGRALSPSLSESTRRS